MNKKNIDFFFEYYEKSNIPDTFSEVLYIQEQKKIANSNYNASKNLENINSIFFIPNYIIPKIDSNLFKVKKVTQFFKGYTVLLDEFTTVDDYLKFRFKKNAKSILKRVKRLELCFPISYHFFYGSISQVDYDFFMNSLKEMIINRFKQRDDISQNLLNWDHYQKIFFSLINEKKASLFVIKNDDEPICISISNHFNGKLFSSVSSYNIDYGKFSLGNIEIYKKLEWCLKNGHNAYEMGMGDLSYKREWSNNIYNFEYQIIYPKKSILGIVRANIEYAKVQMKEGLYKIAYVKYKAWKAKRKKTTPFLAKYSIAKLDNELTLENFSIVDFNIENYHFLRKPLFDFLYLSIENISTVVIYEVSKPEKIYLIVGKTKRQQVVFT